MNCVHCLMKLIHWFQSPPLLCLFLYQEDQLTWDPILYLACSFFRHTISSFRKQLKQGSLSRYTGLPNSALPTELLNSNFTDFTNLKKVFCFVVAKELSSIIYLILSLINLGNLFPIRRIVATLMSGEWQRFSLFEKHILCLGSGT